MNELQKLDENHISKSIKQIDSETWLIGGWVLHRSPPRQSRLPTWQDRADLSGYKLSIAPAILDGEATPLDSPHIKLIHAGDACAIWSIGHNVWLKARYIMEGFTPESVTLNHLQARRPLSFQAPRVISSATWIDREFLFVEKVQGRTLDNAWPSLDSKWRDFYVSGLAYVCMEIESWKWHKFGGVDGQNIAEYYLIRPSGPNKMDVAAEEFSSANLKASCEQLGMDCSDLVFNFTLNPKTIIVEDEPVNGSIAISDFEVAGYFPRKWIGTKCRISSEMCLSTEVADDKYWLAKEVSKLLKSRGFDDVAEKWWEWAGIKNPS